MSLNDIVNVNITRQTQSVSEAGFGIPLLLGTNKNWNDLYRAYSSLQEVSEDFNAFDPEYIASQQIFAQSITPTQIYIGRRTVNTVDIFVETSLPATTYTITINGTAVSITSTPAVLQSVVTLSGIVTATITYSANFGNDNQIVTTVNNLELPPVTWTTSQANTLTLIANSITAAFPTAVTSATPGSNSIVVVFASSSFAEVNSSIASGTSAPTTAIAYLGPLVTANSVAFVVNGGLTLTQVFSVDNATTMGLIAAQIAGQPNIVSAIVTGFNNNIISVVSTANNPGVINSFVVTLGTQQATAAIVNHNQPVSSLTIANALVTAINIAALGVTATDNFDGSFVLNANVSGVPYTVAVSTSIIEPDTARVKITQVIPNQAYTVRINGTQFVYQAPNNVVDDLEVAAGLVAAINTLFPLPPKIPIAKLQPVTAVDNFNGTFEINADIPGVTFNIIAFPAEVMVVEQGLIVGPYIPSGSVVTDIQAIQGVNDNWYGLVLLDRTVSTVKSVAAYIETQTKIFGTASADPNIINQAPGIDLSSIAYFFNSLGYFRTFVMFHQDADTSFPEAAWMGNVLPLQPGSETWKFKTLPSVAYSPLSTTQENNVFGKEANTYEYIGGVGITQNGTMAQGEFIDIIRGVDWLTATIQSYVYSTLVLNPKVPYTNAGIAAIESQVRRAILLGIANNFIASEPPYTISVPNATTVPSIDKANRILNNVKFQCTLAGAIHAVNITGTVSV